MAGGPDGGVRAVAVALGVDVDELRRILDTAYPGEEARYFHPMSIGSAPEHADKGAGLILSGVKTLTSSPFWDYPDGKIPFVGALSVLLDGARKACRIVETTRVEIMSFQAITESMAQAYGEGERTGGEGRWGHSTEPRRRATEQPSPMTPS